MLGLLGNDTFFGKNLWDSCWDCVFDKQVNWSVILPKLFSSNLSHSPEQCPSLILAKAQKSSWPWHSSVHQKKPFLGAWGVWIMRVGLELWVLLCQHRTSEMPVCSLINLSSWSLWYPQSSKKQGPEPGSLFSVCNVICKKQNLWVMMSIILVFDLFT